MLGKDVEKTDWSSPTYVLAFSEQLNYLTKNLKTNEIEIAEDALTYLKNITDNKKFVGLGSKKKQYIDNLKSINKNIQYAFDQIADQANENYNEDPDNYSNLDNSNIFKDLPQSSSNKKQDLSF